MKNIVKVIKGLAFTAVLALSLMATSGSAAAKTDKPTTLVLAPIVNTTGVTWEGSGFTALGVTWE